MHDEVMINVLINLLFMSNLNGILYGLYLYRIIDLFVLGG